MIALRCTIYKKTGDDNGTIHTYVYNINRGGTRFLTQDEIISDTIRLKKLNQTYFSRHLIDKVIPEKVLFVPVDELPLPQNISVRQYRGIHAIQSRRSGSSKCRSNRVLHSV